MNQTTLHKTQPTPAAAAWRGWIWPGLVVALLLGQVALSTVAVVLATGDASVAVEPDYYAKAQHWGQGAALGWRATAHVDSVADATGQRVVTLELRDRDGAPIDAPSADVSYFHHARGKQRHSATLTAVAPGVLAAKLPLERTGVWELRFNVRRGAEVFDHVQQVDLGR